MGPSVSAAHTEAIERLREQGAHIRDLQAELGVARRRISHLESVVRSAVAALTEGL